MAKLNKHPLQNMGINVTLHLPQGSGFCWKLLLFFFFLRYGYSFPLKKKSEAAEQFQALVRGLENTDEMPERTEVYVSDHGGETITPLFPEIFGRL